ncbi:vascular endothelial growth factor A-like isoform X2 [Larimichthys crocea]|uniref:vascular endothelial growth factor A-like isoform X2 n=1 Tax=Larimichthys crocea TaxID=215358 RepID=UPI000F5E3488|nr:vascular endothelial growth factor A-like isoform X2 [Larimichthys crocea]
MQSFIGISHFLLALLLQRVPAQISHPPKETHTKVMTFHEVWVKSMCRPMEQLVDVEQEYPGEVEYVYMPACVPLWRCSGCCGDDNLECQPTHERNITLQVMRLNPMIHLHHVELTFVEHQSCECRTRQKPQNNKSVESIRNRPRRRKQKKTANDCDQSIKHQTFHLVRDILFFSFDSASKKTTILAISFGYNCCFLLFN